MTLEAFKRMLKSTSKVAAEIYFRMDQFNSGKNRSDVL